MSDQQIIALNENAHRSVARDEATHAYLHALGVSGAVLGGCPTMALGDILEAGGGPPTEPDGILISIRNPELMSIPLTDQARVRVELERIIKVAEAQGLGAVRLLCHDKRDMTFAASLGRHEYILPDDVHTYFHLLRSARLVLSFRLHAFLPCVALRVPSINISYDERSVSMVRTIGMQDWDINLIAERDVASAVMDRMARLDEFSARVLDTHPRHDGLLAVLNKATADFATAVTKYAGERDTT